MVVLWCYGVILLPVVTCITTLHTYYYICCSVQSGMEYSVRRMTGVLCCVVLVYLQV